MKKILASVLMLGLSSALVTSNANFLGFGQGELKNYDENTILGNEMFSNSNFSNPFGGSYFPRLAADCNYTHRGITSANQQESDSYLFYDSVEDNTFVRMGNYNGNLATSEGTRISFWYCNSETNERENLPATSYMNVSFQYRFYIDDITRLSLGDNATVLRYQSRNSASTKSGDAFVRNLIINEPGDLTWHTFTTRLSCSSSSMTEYCWFWFFYNGIEASNEPTYYCDIDNMTVTLDGGKNVIGAGGTFEEFDTSDILPTVTGGLYNNLYYRSSYGKSAVQASLGNKFGARLNSDTNKSTFSVGLDSNADALRVEFDYKNLSYYNEPDLDLMVNGLTGIKYENLLVSELLTASAVSYIKDLGNDWNKYVIYLDTSTLETLTSLDFVLESDCDLGITNLHIAEVKSVEKTAGDYEEFVAFVETSKDTLGDYAKKYINSSVVNIQKALLVAESITEYSSEARMITAKALLNNAIASAQRKGDIEGLRAYLDQILDEMAGTNKYDYEIRGYVTFAKALEYAYSLDENATYEVVEEAKQRVKDAYENLVRKENI